MPKRKENLNDIDRRVLVEMYDDHYQYIAALAADANLTPAQVRRSYRKMKRMGLTYYATGWNEDEGQVAGSGYFLTPQGLVERDRLRKEMNYEPTKSR
jgi:hypothetical protein